MAHAEGIFAAGADARVWTFVSAAPFKVVADAEAWIAGALEMQERGQRAAFAIIDRAAERVAGSTSYLAPRPEHRGVEIGWTWLAPEIQRTHVNTECKFLLLRHAFDELGAIRVEFKTDRRNLASQKALERIGARMDGIHRNHMILYDGTIRDSVYYSITDRDWREMVKGHLEKLLSQNLIAPTVRMSDRLSSLSRRSP